MLILDEEYQARDPGRWGASSNHSTLPAPLDKLTLALEGNFLILKTFLHPYGGWGEGEESESYVEGDFLYSDRQAYR